jgi:HlyD family secretion protein
VRYLSAVIVFAATVWVPTADGPSMVPVVEEKAFTRMVTLAGQLEAAESITVTTPSVSRQWAYTITTLTPEGAVVRPGDVLIEFDPDELERELETLEEQREEARIEIALKEAELESRRQDLLLALANAEKNLKVAELWAQVDPHLIPQADAEKYTFDLEKAQIEVSKALEQRSSLDQTAETELEIAELKFKEADLRLRRVLTDLEQLSVKAPSAGMVIHEENLQTGRKIQKGDTLFRGWPAIRLPDLSEIKVVAHVYEQEFQLLREGMPAEVILDALPDIRLEGRVTNLPLSAKPKSFRSLLKTFPVEVTLNKADPSIMRPGMTARAIIPVELGYGLVAPRSALNVDGKGETFLVAEPGGQYVPVKVLQLNESCALIEAPVKPGDRLRIGARKTAVQKSAAVEWLPVRKDELIFSIPGTGTLAAERSAVIRPPFIRRFSNFTIVRMVAEGSEVAPGDVLVEFDPTEFMRRLQDETANLQKAREELEKRRLSRELEIKNLDLQVEEAKVQKERTQNRLLKSQQSEGMVRIREAEYEATLAEQRVEMLERKLASIRKRVELELAILGDKESFRERRVELLQDAMRSLSVEAPISGRAIFEVNWNNEKKQVGSSVHVRETIMSIPDQDSLYVEANIAEIDAGKVRQGQPVILTVDAIPDRTFSGEIIALDNVFKVAGWDRPVKVLGVRIKIHDLDKRRMRPGMAVRVQVIIDRFQETLAIPVSAIHIEAGRSFVWVREKSGPVRRQVQLGRDNGIVAVVEEGLWEGQEVASRPVL